MECLITKMFEEETFLHFKQEERISVFNFPCGSNEREKIFYNNQEVTDKQEGITRPVLPILVLFSDAHPMKAFYRYQVPLDHLTECCD